MATGTWNEKSKPSLPGFYNRFKFIAESRLNQGANGVIAMPVKSDWGPVKKVISIQSEKQLINTFGSNMDLTAYKLGRLILLGNPKEVLLYRLVDGEEKAASIALKDTTPTTAVTVMNLETLYPTNRNFNITIKPDIVDNTLTDIVLYDGAEILYTFKVSGSIADIADKINNNDNNVWIKATKAADGNGTLASIVNQAFTGGNNGTTSITNQQYIDAMTAFESYKIDAFTLDGVGDTALQMVVQAWIDKNKSNGADLIGYMGSKGDSSTTIDDVNSQSRTFNDEAIVNVGVGGVYEGIKYTPAEVACYIAGLATGKGIKESICNEETIFEDVSPKLNRDEINACEAAGTLILVNEDQSIIVVDDVNTLKKFNDDQSAALGYIRAVKFLYAVDKDTSLKRNEFLGKVSNNNSGQKVVISALKKYFETLQSNEVISDFDVNVDSDLMQSAKDDEFYWKWDATYVNVMKKIYGTGYVK